MCPISPLLTLMKNIVRVYKLVTHILPYVLCSLLFGLFWPIFKVIQGQARTFGFIMVIFLWLSYGKIL